MTDETGQELAQALRETELVAAQLVPEFRSSSAWIQQTHEEISCDPELNFEDGAVHTLVGAAAARGERFESCFGDRARRVGALTRACRYRRRVRR